MKCKFYRKLCKIYRKKCNFYRLKCNFYRLKCKNYRKKCKNYTEKSVTFYRKKVCKLKKVKCVCDPNTLPSQLVFVRILQFKLNELLFLFFEWFFLQFIYTRMHIVAKIFLFELNVCIRIYILKKLIRFVFW